MSRNRTLWGSLLALLMVIGFATPAFAQDAIDDAVAAVEDVTNDTTEDSQNSDAATDLLVAPETPSPLMALAEASEDKPWYEQIKVGGSFRFRQQIDYTEGNAHPQGNLKQHRVRYRLLLNIGGKFDDFEFGVQLGSTVGATSANAVVGTVGTGVPGGSTNLDFVNEIIAIRQAWARVSFADELLRITMGVFPFPKTMYRSILTFDSDIALGGLHIVAAVMEEKDDKKKISQALYINALMIYLGNQGNNFDDPIYFAGTVDFRMGGLQAGAGFHHVTHQDLWGIGNVAAGASPRAGSAQFDLKSQGGPNFAAFELYVKYDLSEMGVPLSVYVHTIYNTGGFRGFGALGGVTFKDGKGEGAIVADLIYYYQQGHAWPQIWSDADTGRNGSMAGNTGIEINAKYYLTDHVAIGIEWNFFAIAEDTIVGSDDRDRGMILMFDVYFEW